MRFDLDRVLAFVPNFRGLRIPGSPAMDEAAQVVITEFQRAGLSVRRGEQPGWRPTEPRSVEVWTTSLLAIIAGIALHVTAGWGIGRGSPWLLAAIFSTLAGVAIVLRWLFLSRGGPAVSTVPYVVGTMTGEGVEPNEPDPTAPRVVVLTHLDTRPTAMSYRFRRDLAALELIWLAALWVPCVVVGGWAWLATAGPALLIGLGLIGLVRRVDPWIQDEAPYPADNRTGLALLIELARRWSRKSPSGAQVRFVAAGAPSETWDPATREDLLGGGDRTLVIVLEAPGLGDVVRIAASGDARSRAEAAARDLWIPFRVERYGAIPLDHRAISATGVQALTIAGDLDGGRIDEKLLNAAATLTLELGLRWLNVAAGSNSS